MESSESPTTSKESNQLITGDIEIISNWKIINDKLLHNTISSVDVTRSPGRAALEDVVSLETCIRLEGEGINEKRDPCSITIRLKNGQKMARIAVVSEAFLIEIYKQFGEYVSTAHAEFIDEFEQSAVYFADVCLTPPTPEVSIKFARLKNPGEPMWLYGIRLSLTECLPKNNNKQEGEFDYKVIGNLLQSKPKSEITEKIQGDDKSRPTNHLNIFLRDFMELDINPATEMHILSSNNECGGKKSVMKKENVHCIGDSKDIFEFDFKTYIDDRLKDMEDRLNKKIDTMNYKTNEKLDNIIRLLGDKSL